MADPASDRPTPDRPIGEPPALQTPSEWGREGLFKVWLQIAGACCMIGVVLTAAGAFGTSGLRIAPRFAYWVMLMLVGASFGVTVTRYVIPDRWFHGRPWLLVVPIALCTAIPMSVVVALAESLVTRHPFRWMHIGEVFPTTLVTSLAITALAFIIRTRGHTATHAAKAGAPPPKFLARLPDKLKGAEIWAVEAQDHYLRLHTSLGQDLILMRLSDAIVELEGIEGAQTHRSWWVAKTAVTQTERAEGRGTLTLKDGAKVPVSRGFVKMLREEGWF